MVSFVKVTGHSYDPNLSCALINLLSEFTVITSTSRQRELTGKTKKTGRIVMNTNVPGVHNFHLV